MEQISIRQINLNDLPQLQQIGRQTFFETFAATSDPVNMHNYLQESFSTEKLHSELINPNSAFYFAELDGQVIGYLKINTGNAQTEPQDEKTMEIQRIYVSQKFYGQQVGQMLMNKAIEIAKSFKLNYIWLGVWDQNPRAIRFYEKNGFVIFGHHVFKFGNEEELDMMMKLEL